MQKNLYLFLSIKSYTIIGEQLKNLYCDCHLLVFASWRLLYSIGKQRIKRPIIDVQVNSNAYNGTVTEIQSSLPFMNNNRVPAFSFDVIVAFIYSACIYFEGLQPISGYVMPDAYTAVNKW